jgi:TRAP-type C4-dicarboxylate transport system permease small subunit
MPPLSNPTFLEYLYIYAYIVSIAFFLLFCWGTNYYHKFQESGELAAEQHINKVDWKFQLVALITLALLVPLAFILL